MFSRNELLKKLLQIQNLGCEQWLSVKMEINIKQTLKMQSIFFGETPASNKAVYVFKITGTRLWKQKALFYPSCICYIKRILKTTSSLAAKRSLVFVNSNKNQMLRCSIIWDASRAKIIPLPLHTVIPNFLSVDERFMIHFFS